MVILKLDQLCLFQDLERQQLKINYHLLKLGATAFDGVPVLAQIVTPDRWLLWLGVLFVLSVYHFPTGVVGRLRARALAARGGA